MNDKNTKSYLDFTIHSQDIISKMVTDHSKMFEALVINMEKMMVSSKYKSWVHMKLTYLWMLDKEIDTLKSLDCDK